MKMALSQMRKLSKDKERPEILLLWVCFCVLLFLLGMKNEEEAEKAKSYFNNTYLDTSKISVTFAYPQKSALIPRPWSKYSKVFYFVPN
jgi:hypothetical protein